MAQARVTEFYATKKRTGDAQPSKRRKLQINTDVSEAIQSEPRNTRSTRSSTRGKGISTPVIAEPENVLFTLSVPDKSAKSKSTKSVTQRTRKIKQIKGQQSIADVLRSRSPSPTPSSASEEITSAWDEHDGPLTPSKKSKQNNENETKGKTQTSKKRTRQSKIKEDLKTPPKEEKEETVRAPRSRKKLQLRSNVIASSESENSENEVIEPEMKSEKQKYREVLDLPTTPLAISPLPDTPEVVRQQMEKGPKVPTSNKVQAAMEKLKELNKEGTTMEEVSKSDMTEKLKKCGKLEELKAQLLQLNEAKKEMKKIKESKEKPKTGPMVTQAKAPELSKFEAIEVKVETQEELEPASDQKAPAYERFHHLATPAPPSLSLPYKYKLLEDMFRSMDTVVSMLHNRSEICTFSKLKTAVQEMTKRNFEQRNVGQIKTVYPEAYTFRQEKGLPAFGGKSHDYQLTVEPNFNDELENKLKTKSGRPCFAAKDILQRKTTFHNKLISIVMKHHKSFLSSLSRPLSVPGDKITRWHPKFSLDEVPDIPVDSLPEAPYVKKYQSAIDVLEDNKAKLPDRVKKALNSVAMENMKKDSSNPQEPSAAKNLPQLQGVPQSLLEKVRAREAKKQELAMMRDPVEDKRSLMIRRLPEMMRILRAHFVTEKKPALTMENIVQKLTDSYKTTIQAADVETHVKLLIELVPEWLTVVEIKKGKYVKMDRNIELGSLQSKVVNMAKS
ncbi:DNA replication factor Cdt1-like [Saccostrea echinata]|uniref:DNA replication factor Cdt1-like n=1 Tax=Saccostrea echinata TaxID=191078 RepID=UPI002A81C3BD|nr:DNA replication factor Cdt1-like [Saccostrea echinata]